MYFTFDEEIGFDGIKLLVNNGEQFPKYLILAEPTDLKPVIATKGCMEFKVDFFGKSAHSSTPEEGNNAIISAHKYIGELLEFSEELKQEKNEMFSVPYTTINIGKIKGGDAVNKIPDKCSIQFDARTIDNSHNILIEKKVQEVAKKYDCKVENYINIGANINFDNKMIETIEKITGNKRISENYVTEASFIKNSNSVIMGLGPITAHKCNEYIEKDKLNKLVEIYERIIEEYCY